MGPFVRTAFFTSSLAAIGLAAAPVGYYGPTAIETVRDNETVYLVDLDRDQALDLVFTHQTGGMTIRYGAGDGTFAAPRTISLSGWARSVRFADLDGRDGPDAVASFDGVNGATDAIGVLLNDGAGGLRGGATISLAGARAFDFLDVDGDGSPDLVMGGTNAGPVVSLNDGDGGFAEPVSLGIGARTGLNASSLAAADLDGDGDVDFALHRGEHGAPRAERRQWQLLRGGRLADRHE